MTRHSLAAVALLVSIFAFTAAAARDQVHKPGNGVTLPSVVSETKPDYTEEAKQAGIQGSVWMKVVVLADGNVGNVQVTRSLDDEFGLDLEAVKAAKQWKFKPGQKDGKPVAVEVTVEMTFRLK